MKKSLMLFALLFTLFIAFPHTAYAAGTVDIKYSPLFEASLQDTLREFAEKEAGEYSSRLNSAVTEKAATADIGDISAKIAVGIPGVPNIPKPPVNTYTTSYSCGATCGATCTSTCTATCTATCGATCGATCNTTCASTCAGTSTCLGSSTCAGGSTCVGTNTCFSSSCAGSSTCFGTSTCSGATCLGASTCLSGCNIINPPLNTAPTTPTTPSQPLPETTTTPPASTGSGLSSWAEGSVAAAIIYGFVPQELQSNYQSNITRQEFCRLSIQFLKQILDRDPEYAGIMDENLGESPFSDVDDNSVTWAYYLEIVSGVGNERFNPNGQITRQEAAVMLSNMVENVFGQDIDAPRVNYGDSGSMASWATDAIDFVSDYGIMSGTGNNMFSPLSPYTREQSLVTIIRLYDAFLAE